MTSTTFARGLQTLVAAALLLASAACRSAAPAATTGVATPGVATPQATAQPPSAGLLARIDAARGNAACDSDAQCHSIGVGAKACGGPERYLAWSSRDDDGARLRALVAEHAQARRAEDAKAGMMSTCSVVPDPGAVCAGGQCVLRAAGPGPGGSEAR